MNTISGLADPGNVTPVTVLGRCQKELSGQLVTPISRVAFETTDYRPIDGLGLRMNADFEHLP